MHLKVSFLFFSQYGLASTIDRTDHINKIYSGSCFHFIKCLFFNFNFRITASVWIYYCVFEINIFDGYVLVCIFKKNACISICMLFILIWFLLVQTIGTSCFYRFSIYYVYEYVIRIHNIHNPSVAYCSRILHQRWYYRYLVCRMQEVFFSLRFIGLIYDYFVGFYNIV